MYTTHSEYASQSGFLPQFATVYSLFTAYGQLCVVLWLLYTNQPANSSNEFGCGRDACSKEEKTKATFKHYERLGYQQVFGYAQTFQRLVFFGIRAKTGILCACKCSQ